MTIATLEAPFGREATAAAESASAPVPFTAVVAGVTFSDEQLRGQGGVLDNLARYGGVVIVDAHEVVVA